MNSSQHPKTSWILTVIAVDSVRMAHIEKKCSEIKMIPEGTQWLERGPVKTLFNCFNMHIKTLTWTYLLCSTTILFLFFACLFKIPGGPGTQPSGRAFAWPAQGPELNPRHSEKKNRVGNTWAKEPLALEERWV